MVELLDRRTLNKSLRVVVENLDSTPSSQLRAFWRETPGAAAIRSVPTETEAKARDAPAAAATTRRLPADRFNIAEAMALQW